MIPRGAVVPLLLLSACAPKDLPADGSTTQDTDANATEPTSGPTGSGFEPPACMNVTMTEVTTADEAGETGTTTASDDPCVGHPISDGCCCFEPSEKDVKVVCDVTFPCPDIELHCEHAVFFDGCPDLFTKCDAAIDCALEVLITGEPAGVRWWRRDEGYSTYESELYLAGDGTGFLSHFFAEDLSAGFDTIDRKQLASVEFFAACKQRPTPIERFECIENALIGYPIDEPVETCVPGFTIPF
jgi:hypothetical protein